MLSRAGITPHEDYGFFGPGSVTWKVWGFAATPIIGIQRATVIEELDPNLLAAVDATGDNYRRLGTRYARTVRYFASVALADTRTVTRMADILVKVHSKAIGIEPVSGGRYDANDPASQLWILLTGWHSVLKTYEMFGPGKLTPAEEGQYWEECAVAAELQTCDPADVPRTRDGIHAYFEHMRPQLAASEATQRMMIHLANGPRAILPKSVLLRPAVVVVNWFVRAGTLATIPRWMRDLGGLKQSRLIDATIPLVLRPTFLLLHRLRPVKMLVLSQLAGSTVPVVAPIWYGVPPLTPEVLTPAEARERYGLPKPAEAHLELRARQYDRVFTDQVAPSDEGLIESQSVLGRLG
jgi:uncharacterized protein (DUF2236 family)